jgi:hypothetical protein
MAINENIIARAQISGKARGDISVTRGDSAWRVIARQKLGNVAAHAGAKHRDGNVAYQWRNGIRRIVAWRIWRNIRSRGIMAALFNGQ